MLVRSEGNREVSRDVAHYNLDAIISVGYRVNSKQGVKFRQWATQTLNDHLVKGFTLNQQHIAEHGIREAQEAISLLSRTLLKQENLNGESREALTLISNYAKTWKTLLQYDEQSLTVPLGTPARCALDYQAALSEIDQLKTILIDKGEATPLFGQRRGDAFEGILGNIEQTMFGESLYKSREEKAANLLYFIIKDHPFSDGNKRIGSFMFLRYMEQQGMSTEINPDAMVALALLVAESKPENKDMMIKLTMNSIVEHAVHLEKNESERGAGYVESYRAATQIAAEKGLAVVPLVVPDNGKIFEGKILGVTEFHVLQNRGKTAVIHSKDNLDRIPAQDEVVNISYDANMRGIVEPKIKSFGNEVGR